MKRWLRATAAVLLAGGLLGGCGRSAPEDELREWLADAEQSAEDRSPRRLVALLAGDFRTADGADAAAVERYLRGWFLAHPSVHLLTRIDRLDLPATDLAELELTVGMVGRDGAASFDLAADVYAIDLTLVREDGDWRVTRAAWRSLRR